MNSTALETASPVPAAEMPEGGPSLRRLPPYCIYRGFFERDMVARLLDYAQSQEGSFEPTGLRGDRTDPEIRVSQGLYDLGPLQKELEQRLLRLTPELIERLHVSPFEASELELQLIAHGDGAFYKRHIDTFTRDREGDLPQRMLSGVYYFNAEPKSFSGGALRLYAFGGSETSGPYADIQPECNSLLVFPSWAPHEVLPVSCPSGRFMDSRFAINCWILRTRPQT